MATVRVDLWKSPDERDVRIVDVDPDALAQLCRFVETGNVPSDPMLREQLDEIRSRVAGSSKDKIARAEVVGAWLDRHGRPVDLPTFSAVVY